MCGVGVIASKSDTRGYSLEKYQDVIRHRGPDSTQVETLKHGPVSIQLLHHRLAIIDLDEAASQPFWSSDKKAVLAYNGEIYNYLEVKKELESLGRVFRTTSDTEVLLQALLQWPAEEALTKLNGMWAFLFFDLNKNQVVISRDRFGEKPLYYSSTNESVMFASEIKLLLKAFPQKYGVEPTVAASYLSSFLLDADEEKTFFSGVKKFPAGCYAVQSIDKFSGGQLDIKPYYQPQRQTQITDFASAKKQLAELIEDSVALRFRSDVPVGILFSGGVDSSVVTGAAFRRFGPKGLNCISIVSEDPRYDESKFINLLAKKMGFNSIKINVSADSETVFESLQDSIYSNDEPLTSFSAVTYKMMLKKAKEQGITVLLTGQGADELFLGYRKYLGFYMKELLRKGAFSSVASNSFGMLINQPLLSNFPLSEVKRYFGKQAPNQMVLGPQLAGCPIPDVGLGRLSLYDRQLLDIKNFSIPALLHFEDRLSMAHSREVRVPYLDHRIVDLALSLPTDFSIRHGWSKYILRSVADDMLPREISWRRDKKGFTIPQEHWLRNEFKERVSEIFKSDCIMYQQKWINRDALLQKYERFLSPDRSASLISFKEIFAPLAFELWLRTFSNSLNFN